MKMPILQALHRLIYAFLHRKKRLIKSHHKMGRRAFSTNFKLIQVVSPAAVCGERERSTDASTEFTDAFYTFSCIVCAVCVLLSLIRWRNSGGGGGCSERTINLFNFSSFLLRGFSHDWPHVLASVRCRNCAAQQKGETFMHIIITCMS